MTSNKPHTHDYVQKVDAYDQLRWHECVICKQWEECNCTEKEFEKFLLESTKYSEDLINETLVYLEKNTGSRPSKELIEDFLRSVSRLGKLILKNADKISNGS